MFHWDFKDKRFIHVGFRVGSRAAANTAQSELMSPLVLFRSWSWKSFPDLYVCIYISVFANADIWICIIDFILLTTLKPSDRYCVLHRFEFIVLFDFHFTRIYGFKSFVKSKSKLWLTVAILVRMKLNITNTNYHQCCNWVRVKPSVPALKSMRRWTLLLSRGLKLWPLLTAQSGAIMAVNI